jgi:hypothetical protein
VNELATLGFTATATDPDAGQTLTFSLDSGNPAGSSINATGGDFSWTPTEAHGPGGFPIAVRVTDNGTGLLSDFEAVTITVNEVNRAPVIAPIGNKTVVSGAVLSFTVAAFDTADVPANFLAFSLDPGAPAGATIGATTGDFTWTASVPGVYPARIRVTDNGVPPLSAAELILITVGDPTNRAPILAAIGDRTVNESAPLTFTATATDPDPGQSRTFSLDAGAPAGVTINGSTGAFAWTPAEALGPGAYPVTVRVTDNGTPPLSDFETFTITVNDVNLAPILAAIGDKTVATGATLNFTATATDADVPVNTFTFSLDAGAPMDAVIDASSGAFSWTTVATGSYPITVRVTDNGSPALADFEAISITVTDQAPVTTLRSNFPNPFAAATVIGYTLQAEGRARLAIYDIRGREVSVLIDEVQPAGDHTVAWNGTSRTSTPLASGVYFYRLTAGGRTLAGRMILAR